MKIFRITGIVLMVAALWGCGKANESTVTLDANGKHPANWIVAHREAFRKSVGAVDTVAGAAKSSCAECHGSDLKGGITGVSCFSARFGALSCHFHPAGFNDPAVHGPVAKGYGDSAGFRLCQGCHGTVFNGGTLSGTSCQACHGVAAPHPGNWALGALTHFATDTRNAAVCAQCHLGGRLLTSISPPPPQPAGTKPGCFNNTLCHAAVGHPAGWSATGHQAAAKAVAGATSGMDSCRTCHGADFRGAASGVSCFNTGLNGISCHATSPHSKPWLGSSGATSHIHSSTDPSNATACGRCHDGGNKRTVPVAPPAGAGCFNNTLCHGTMGHPAGWATAGHQVAAKAVAGATTGLDYCRSCHGNDFQGGGTGVSCFSTTLNGVSCHATSPHSKPWLGSSGAVAHVHSTTDESNATACGRCHAGGAKLSTPVVPPAGAGCFNSTLCHGSMIAHAFPNPGSVHKGSTSGCNSCHSLGTGASPYPAATGKAAPDCKSCHKLSTATAMAQMTDPHCSDCHGNAATGRPSGTTFPNRAGRHSNPGEHAVACNNCHGGGGTGTATHGNSNHVVKTAADVVLNGTAAGMVITRKASGVVTCTGTCHGVEQHNGRTW